MNAIQKNDIMTSKPGQKLRRGFFLSLIKNVLAPGENALPKRPKNTQGEDAAWKKEKEKEAFWVEANAFSITCRYAVFVFGMRYPGSLLLRKIQTLGTVLLIIHCITEVYFRSQGNRQNCSSIFVFFNSLKIRYANCTIVSPIYFFVFLFNRCNVFFSFFPLSPRRWNAYPYTSNQSIDQAKQAINQSDSLIRHPPTRKTTNKGNKR